MLIVRVELHSVITGKISEIARMRIYNTGEGSRTRGAYVGEVFRGRSFEALDLNTVHKRGEIEHWPRLSKHVWCLVAAMLKSMNYIGEEQCPQATSPPLLKS